MLGISNIKITESNKDTIGKLFFIKCRSKNKSFIVEYNDFDNHLIDHNLFNSHCSQAAMEVIASYMGRMIPSLKFADVLKSAVYLADTYMTNEVHPKHGYMSDSVEILDLPNDIKIKLRGIVMTVGELYSQLLVGDILDELDSQDFQIISKTIFEYFYSKKCVLNRTNILFNNRTIALKSIRINGARSKNNKGFSIMYKNIESDESMRLYIKEESAKDVVDSLLDMQPVADDFFSFRIIDLYSNPDYTDSKVRLYINIMRYKTDITVQCRCGIEVDGVYVYFVKFNSNSLSDMSCFINSLYYLSGKGRKDND